MISFLIGAIVFILATAGGNHYLENYGVENDFSRKLLVSSIALVFSFLASVIFDKFLL
jgi:hypothetical protein